MRTRLIKEARELLPALAVTLLLIAVPYAIWGNRAESAAAIALAVGAAIMGALSFGHEFQHRTMPLLLSQPIARQSIWREKMLVLGLGLLIASATAWLYLHRFCSVDWETAVMTGTLGVIALCAFCGAPTLTLVGKNTIAGAVCAICIPGLIALVDSIVIERWFGNERVPTLWLCGCSLVLYCVATAWMGYYRFQRLQALDGTSRELALPSAVETVLARPLAQMSSKFAGPFAALIKKELRLQQTTFLLTGFFSVFALGGAFVLVVSKDWGIGLLAADFAIYMLLLPLVAGGLSVAEERGWGIAEWHLTLPPSAKLQWLAKMLVTLPLSLLLGLALPAGLYLAGARLLEPGSGNDSLPSAFQCMTFVALQLFVTSLTVYAATFFNSTIKAILGSFGLILGIGLALSLLQSAILALAELIGLAAQPSLAEALAWEVSAAAIPLFLCLLQWFAFSNYRQRGASMLRYTCQVIGLLFAAVVYLFVLTGLS